MIPAAAPAAGHGSPGPGRHSPPAGQTDPPPAELHPGGDRGAAGERGSWGVTGQYMGYGTMKETTVNGQQTGEFSAKDIAVGGTFAYALNEKFSGGITARFVASYIGSYNSLGAAVDLGLNYYDDKNELSISAVAKTSADSSRPTRTTSSACPSTCNLVLPNG